MFDYTRKRRVAVYKRKKVPFQRTQLVYRSGAATEAQTRNLAQNLQKYHNKQIPEPEIVGWAPMFFEKCLFT
jgi:hypothetical protein